MRLLMTGVTLLVGKRGMPVVVEQLRLVGTVRVVALTAAGAGKRLVKVSCLQRGITRIVTVQAKRRLRLGEVEDTFRCACRVALVSGVTSGAAQIHGCMLLWFVDLRRDVAMAA